MVLRGQINKTTVNMPIEIWQALKRRAKRQHRSTGKELVAILEKELEDEFSGAEEALSRR